MKNSNPSPKPRLLCQLVRTCRAVSDGAGKSHVAACADCQAFERAAGELDAELRREAIALRRTGPAPSPGLARSIQQAVRLEKAATVPVRSRANFSLWFSGAIAAAAAMVFAVYVTEACTSSSVTTAAASCDSLRFRASMVSR